MMCACNALAANVCWQLSQTSSSLICSYFVIPLPSTNDCNISCSIVDKLASSSMFASAAAGGSETDGWRTCCRCSDGPGIVCIDTVVSVLILVVALNWLKMLTWELTTMSRSIVHDTTLPRWHQPWAGSAAVALKVWEELSMSTWHCRGSVAMHMQYQHQ